MNIFIILPLFTHEGGRELSFSYFPDMLSQELLRLLLPNNRNEFHVKFHSLPQLLIIYVNRLEDVLIEGRFQDERRQLTN